MIIRAIKSNEILTFEQFGAKDTASPMLDLQKWIDQGRTSLDMCLVAQDSGTFSSSYIFGFLKISHAILKFGRLN